MPKPHIILSYRRHAELTDDEHKMSGRFEIVGKLTNPEPESVVVPFTGGFSDMMVQFAGFAKRWPQAGLFIRRLEQKPEPIAVELDPVSADTLRFRTQEYIDALSPPPRRVVVKITSTSPAVVGPPVLPAGVDALAETFGDDVYFRRRDGRYESPVSGRWEGPGVAGLGRHVLWQSEDWVRCPVQILLERTHVERFYLPRAWNKPGPWISREDLEKRYDVYLKEKKTCTESNKADATSEL